MKLTDLEIRFREGFNGFNEIYKQKKCGINFAIEFHARRHAISLLARHNKSIIF